MYKLLLVIVAIFTVLFSPALAYAGNPPDAAHSSLTATEVPADGTQSVITVTLQDSSGTPLAGDTVKLLDTADPNIVFSPETQVLDASGSATFNAASTTPGTDNIDVMDVTTGTTLTALGQVIFDPLPDNGSCKSNAPPDAPNLYQVVAVKDSATLYIAPGTPPFDGFTISYGLDNKADAYNATFSQGQTSGAITYTVHSLTPNTKYYFMVRANNGCATGPWSSVVSTSGNSTPPVTGSMDFLYFGFGALAMIFGGLRIYTKFK